MLVQHNLAPMSCQRFCVDKRGDPIIQPPAEDIYPGYYETSAFLNAVARHEGMWKDKTSEGRKPVSVWYYFPVSDWLIGVTVLETVFNARV